MPSYRRLSDSLSQFKPSKHINWYPGHMYSGLQAMIGKLNTVDCVVEVHDARIPFIGRNKEFREHLGAIKPRLLVLNKQDLADLSRWPAIQRRLKEQGDENVLLTDLSGSEFSHSSRGYSSLLKKVVEMINRTDRYNRMTMDHFKMMVVGIPNVGKSTLINRLRQHHLGMKGEPAKCGPQAGVTRHVEQVIKVCARPRIYTIDTPGVLAPSSTRNEAHSMQLALCSTITDKILNHLEVADYLLQYLNQNDNLLYLESFGLEHPAFTVDELIEAGVSKKKSEGVDKESKFSDSSICWQFIREFRSGRYGKVMFD